ncbi:MAG: hypothetical protein ACI308_09130 [Muribaculaceae bacterium]
MEEQKHISELTAQALEWLKKMEVEVEYCNPGDFWRFSYRGVMYALDNDDEDNVIGISAMLFFDFDGSKPQTMALDMALDYAKQRYENIDVNIISPNFVTISDWRRLITNRKKPKLHKRDFLMMLKELRECSIDFRQNVNNALKLILQG